MLNIQDMKLKKRAAALVMALTLCMAAGATVNAATVSTSEFGTMTYSLSRSGATVTAVTKTTKAAPKLITKLEVQVNSTGKTIVNTSATKTNGPGSRVVEILSRISPGDLIRRTIGLIPASSKMRMPFTALITFSGHLARSFAVIKTSSIRLAPPSSWVIFTNDSKWDSNETEVENLVFS